jgi:chromate reductase, NAD(P)H dehydrogenase (quinone)
MDRKLKIAVLVGSLREKSLSQLVAKAMAELAQPTLDLVFPTIGDLPLYNEDLESNVPKPWQRFREEIRDARAAIFVTPECNRSVPGVLKNAIDVGSRPYGQAAWTGKPAAVVSHSPGSLGGFGANHHLRQSLVFLDMFALPQPEVYLSNSTKLFDASGKMINDGARSLLEALLQKFELWIRQFKGRMR